MFEYEIYKLKRKHKEHITLGEFKNTLDKALQLANILLEKAINDIIEAKNNSRKYIDMKYWNTYDASNFVTKDIYETLSLTHNTNNFVEDKYHLNIMHYNIDLFKGVMKSLNAMECIYYKGKTSNLTLTKINNLDITINFNLKKKKFYLSGKDTIKITDEMKWLDMPKLENEPITLYTGKTLTNIIDTCVIVDWQTNYYALKNLVDKNMAIILEKEKRIITNKDFFVNEKEKSPVITAHFYKPEIIRLYDLSNIDFNNTNISGLDISHNLEAKINFDKIVHDVSNCNFEGYDLRKVTFRNFDIRNTNFKNTGATIDIGSCMIASEGKMTPGTLFDKNNKFIFGDKKLTNNQVRDLGIKIYQKEK